MTLRPSDIAFTLTRGAMELLRTIMVAPSHELRLTGAPFELMRYRLAQSTQIETGYLISPTALGTEVAEYLKEVGK